MKIKTNNHDRQFVYRYDVPKEVLAGDLDWTTEDDFDGYFKYRGIWYHTSQFVRVTPTCRLLETMGYVSPFYSWGGAHSDSAFSGILIKIADDCETYRVATYFS